MLDLAADFKQALAPSDSAEVDAMRFFVFLGVLAAATACGKVTGATDAGATGAVDAGGGGAGADAGGCAAPQGDAGVCPTTAGNCQGIGQPCTPGGGQCNSFTGTSCDKDLSVSGVGMCVKVFTCTPGQKMCGNGASCCQTPTTQYVAVCMPNQCVPPDCTAEVW